MRGVLQVDRQPGQRTVIRQVVGLPGREDRDHAVGMSTVQEVIAANQAGLRVVGISCLSNMAAGVSDAPLDHKEVMEAGERVRETFIALVDDLVSRIVLLGAF